MYCVDLMNVRSPQLVTTKVGRGAFELCMQQNVKLNFSKFTRLDYRQRPKIMKIAIINRQHSTFEYLNRQNNINLNFEIQQHMETMLYKYNNRINNIIIYNYSYLAHTNQQIWH